MSTNSTANSSIQLKSSQFIVSRWNSTNVSKHREMFHFSWTIQVESSKARLNKKQWNLRATPSGNKRLRSKGLIYSRINKTKSRSSAFLRNVAVGKEAEKTGRLVKNKTIKDAWMDEKSVVQEFKKKYRKTRRKVRRRKNRENKIGSTRWNLAQTKEKDRLS